MQQAETQQYAMQYDLWMIENETNRISVTYCIVIANFSHSFTVIINRPY